MEQAFVKDPDRTIEQVRTDLVGVIGENVEVRRFVRFQLGETVDHRGLTAHGRRSPGAQRLPSRAAQAERSGSGRRRHVSIDPARRPRRSRGYLRVAQRPGRRTSPSSWAAATSSAAWPPRPSGMDRATGDYIGMMATRAERARAPGRPGARVVDTPRHERHRDQGRVRAVHHGGAPCATSRRAASSSAPPARATPTSAPTRRRRCAPWSWAPRPSSWPSGSTTASTTPTPRRTRRRRSSRDSRTRGHRARPASVMDTTALSLCMDNRHADPRVQDDGRQHRARARPASGSAPWCRPPPSADAGKGGVVEKELLDDAKHRMQRAVEAVQTEFNTVRSGRASRRRCWTASTSTTTARPRRSSRWPTIAAPEPRLITVSPSTRPPCEGRREGHHGERPRPQPQQRRPASSACPSRRSPRSAAAISSSSSTASPRTGAWPCATSAATAMKDLKELAHEGEVGEDAEHRAEEQLQKLTDERTCTRSTSCSSSKEAEILEV